MQVPGEQDEAAGTAPEAQEDPEARAFRESFSRLEAAQARPAAEDAAEQEADEFARSFGQIDRKRGELFSLKLQDSREVNPAMAQRVLKAAAGANLPPEIVADDLENIERHLLYQKFNRDEYLANSPSAARFLQKGVFRAGALTWEEIIKLGHTEQYLRRPAFLWSKTPAQQEAEATRLAKARAKREAAAFEELSKAPKGPVPTGAEYVEPIVPKPKPEEAVREEILRAIQDREEYIGRVEPVDWIETIVRKYEDNPFAWMPYGQDVLPAARALALWDAAQKDEQGKPLDEDEQDLLTNYARMQLASQRRGSTWGAKIWDVVTASVPFMLEAYSSAGIYAGAKKLSREAVEKVFKNVVARRMARTVAGWAGGSAAVTAMTGGVKMLENVAERKTGKMVLDVGEHGYVAKVVPGTGEAYWTAIPRAALDVFAAIAAERTSPAFDLVGNKLAAPLKAVWKALAPNLPLGEFTKRFAKVYSRGKIGSLVGEYGEERLEQVIVAFGGTPMRWPTAEESLIELGAFGAMRGMGAGIGLTADAIARRVKPPVADPVRMTEIGKKLQDLGIADPETAARLEAPIMDVLDKGGARYIPLEDLHAYAQTAKPDAAGRKPTARELIEKMGGRGEEYDQALIAGRAVELPGRSVAESAKIDPALTGLLLDDPSALTSKEFDELRIAVEAENKQAEADEQARAAEEKAIIDDLAKRVEATGRYTPQQARANATVLAAMHSVLAPKIGMTAAELYDQTAPTIMRGEGGAEAGLSQGAADDKDLIIQHNITAQKLENVKKLGGLPVPSLAITKADQSITGFGDITLLGGGDLADPRGYSRPKVFGADIYSPRYPDVSYKFTKEAISKLKEKFKDAIEATGRPIDWSSLNDGPRQFAEQTAVIYSFLKSKGVNPIPTVKGSDGRVDNYGTYRAMSKLVGDLGLETELRGYALKAMVDAGAEEKVWTGTDSYGRNKYLPHNLENVVKLLKKGLRGGEGFSYGPGLLRAHYAPEFKSVKAIREAKGRLVTGEQMEAVKKEVQDEFFDVAAALKPFNTYGDSNQFGYSDRVISILSGAARGSVKAELESYGFKGVSDEALQKVFAFLNKLRSLPTEYFEAKITRAVDLSEFKAAVVPDSTPESVITDLQSKGIKVHKYKKNDEADRRRVVRDVASSEGLLFKLGDQGPRGQYTPAALTGAQAIIRLFQSADPTTFMHEAAHHWLEIYSWAASLPRATQAIKDDWQKILDWMGVKDAEAWDKLDLEGRRPYHEKFAEAVEEYIGSGKAPSAKLQDIFDAFKNWIKVLYRTVSGTQLVTPEIRGVFDRMLASEAEIQAAAMDSGLYTGPTAEQMGMVGRTATAYQDALDRASRGADAALTARIMGEIQKKRGKAIEAEMAGIRAEVRKKWEQDPDVQMVVRLQRHRLPDGSKLPKGTPRIRLDRAALEAFEPGVVDRLPVGITAERGGYGLEAAASAFGYPGPGAMIEALKGLQARAGQANASEAEIRRELRDLEDERAALEALDEGVQEQKGEVLKGKPGFAKRLEAALKGEIDASTADLKALLDQIKARGGIRPTDDAATKRIPKGWKAKKGAGVASDELAQELFDRGVISSPDSDTLYDWMEATVGFLNDMKERRKNAAAEARKLSGRQAADALENLIQTIEAQKGLHDLLKAREKGVAAATRDAGEAFLRDAVEREAEGVYRARHAGEDYSFPATLHDWAQKEVHTERTQELLELRLEHLMSEDFAKFKGLAARVGRLGRSDARVNQRAREMISGKKWRDIKPGNYLAAERRASRDAAKAFASGDWEAMADATRRQILNHALYREAVEAREWAEKTHEWAKRYERTETRARIGKAGGNHLEAIDALLETHDLTSNPSQKSLDERRDSVVAALDTLAESGADVPGWLLRAAETKNWKEMTVEELRGLRGVLEQIEHIARIETELSEDAAEASLEDAIRAMLDRSDELPKRKVGAEVRRKVDEWRHKLAEAKYAHLNLASILRELDGQKDGGPWVRFIMRPFHRAGDKQARMQREAAIRFREIVEKHYGKDWNKVAAELQKPIHREQDPDGIRKADLSREARIAIFLNLGNAGDAQRMADSRGWSIDDLHGAVGALDKRDLDFAADVAKMIEGYWPEIARVSRKLTGLVPEKVEATPIETAHGVYPGWYYPIKRESRLSAGAAQKEDVSEAQLHLAKARLAAHTKHGHRKERAEAARDPLRLDLGAIAEHVRDVIHDTTHAEAVSDVSKLLRKESVREAIYGISGPAAWKAMDQAVADIAFGESARASDGMGWGLGFRAGSSVASMGANVMTILKQALGLTQSAVRVGAANLASAMASYTKAPSETVAFVKDSSDMMKLRTETLDRELSQVTEQIGAGRWTLGSRSVAAFFKPLALMQFYTVDVPTWMAQYNKTRAELVGQMDEEAAHKEAAAQADQAVLDTQGGGMTKDLAGVMRGGELKKLLTTYYSYASRTFALAAEAAGKVATPGQRAKGVTDLLMLIALPAALEMAVEAAAGAARGDEDDEDTNLAKGLLKRTVANALNTMVLGRELAGFVQDRRYEGPAGMRYFSDLYRLGTQVEQGELDEAFWKALADVAGTTFKLPSTQGVRTVRGALQMVEEGSVNPFRLILGPSRK